MQPVQDLTVEDRVSRTQYQYSLEAANPNELATWVPQLVDKIEGAAAIAGRGDRPAERGPGGGFGGRSRHCFATRAHTAGD